MAGYELKQEAAAVVDEAVAVAKVGSALEVVAPAAERVTVKEAVTAVAKHLQQVLSY